ncbi:MAG TPA: chemotaxis protein CheB [Flavisolibacter sp.]|jgi:two-component system chemotaxis response regulator CheB|nr:chemotaxis protein CheB [Flavisolibacter sp.]
MAQSSITNRYQLLIIGGSAGSLEVLVQLLPALNKNLKLAIVVVMHRKAGESVLVDVLSGKTTWPVKEAEEKQNIESGNVYLAPSDYHLLFEKNKTFSLDFSEKVHYSRPSIDVSFESVAEAYGAAVIAVLLSGANADGAAGLNLIRNAGGVAIVQDPSEASVAYMPQQAIDNFQVDYIADTKTIIDIINRLATD